MKGTGWGVVTVIRNITEESPGDAGSCMCHRSPCPLQLCPPLPQGPVPAQHPQSPSPRLLFQKPGSSAAFRPPNQVFMTVHGNPSPNSACFPSTSAQETITICKLNLASYSVQFFHPSCNSEWNQNQKHCSWSVVQGYNCCNTHCKSTEFFPHFPLKEVFIWDSIIIYFLCILHLTFCISSP